MSTPEDPTPQVAAEPPARGEPRPFDFLHPTALSREHVRTMQIVQEAMARGISTVLATTLRAVTQANITGITQTSFEKYLGSLPDPALVTQLALGAQVGPAVLDIPLPLAFAATELMLGGSGGAQQPERAMTELELGLMMNIVELMLPVVRSAFEPLVDTSPSITGQESNPAFVQLVGPTDLVVVIGLDVTIEEVSGIVTLCVPFGGLQPHLELLSENARAGSLSADKLAVERARLHEHLGGAAVEASARFRPCRATSDQIIALAPGDVLMLSHPTEMPLTLEVDGTPVHDVRIGRVNRNFAIRVESVIEPGHRRRTSRLQVEPA